MLFISLQDTVLFLINMALVRICYTTGIIWKLYMGCFTVVLNVDVVTDMIYC